MPENDKFFSVNIREYLALGNDEEAREPALLELLSLRDKAIQNW